MTVIPTNPFRPIGDFFLALESVLVGSKIVLHGSTDLSFATQAMRLLMFCTRYLDLGLIRRETPLRLSMRAFILLSTLAVVMLLGYKKCSQGAHRSVSKGTITDVTSILLFSAAFGAAFMYAPVLLEFSWAFSRFIDIVVEVPQLKMTHASDKLDGWIIAYYCSIGSQVFFSTLNLIERTRTAGAFYSTMTYTTISKGIVVAVFFVARFFNQRERGSTEDRKEPILDSGAPYVPIPDVVTDGSCKDHQYVDEKSPLVVVAAV